MCVFPVYCFWEGFLYRTVSWTKWNLAVGSVQDIGLQSFIGILLVQDEFLRWVDCRRSLWAQNGDFQNSCYRLACFHSDRRRVIWISSFTKHKYFLLTICWRLRACLQAKGNEVAPDLIRIHHIGNKTTEKSCPGYEILHKSWANNT